MESGKSIARAALSRDQEFHVRRLSSLASLNSDDVNRLRSAGSARRSIPSGQEIDVSNKPAILVAGWAYRTRVLTDGRRQVYGHLVPGDVLSQRSGSRREGGSFITALVATTVIDAPLPIDGDLETSALGQAYDMAGRIEDQHFESQILRLGRLTAPERLIHLLLEFAERLFVIGAGTKFRFPLPVSQEILADTLGLTTVHINRTLQLLRRQGLVVWDAGYVTLENPPRLAAIAYFNHSREIQQQSRPTLAQPRSYAFC